MKKIVIFFISPLFITSYETISSINKPEMQKPFSKCPPKEKRTLKNILCKE